MRRALLGCHFERDTFAVHEAELHLVSGKTAHNEASISKSTLPVQVFFKTRIPRELSFRRCFRDFGVMHSIAVNLIAGADPKLRGTDVAFFPILIFDFF